MYNWYLFITAVIQHVYEYKLLHILHTALPLASPFILTWHPPVVIGIVHLSPRLLVNYPLVPRCILVSFPPPWLSTPPGFPGPNVLLIRAHPKFSSQYTRQ